MSRREGEVQPSWRAKLFNEIDTAPTERISSLAATAGTTAPTRTTVDAPWPVGSKDAPYTFPPQSNECPVFQQRPSRIARARSCPLNESPPVRSAASPRAPAAERVAARIRHSGKGRGFSPRSGWQVSELPLHHWNGFFLYPGRKVEHDAANGKPTHSAPSCRAAKSCASLGTKTWSRCCGNPRCRATFREQVCSRLGKVSSGRYTFCRPQGLRGPPRLAIGQSFGNRRDSAQEPLFCELYWAAKPPRRLAGGTFLA